MGKIRGTSLLSPPSLSPELNRFYSMLSGDNKRIFSRVFLWVWRYLFGLRSFIERAGSLSMYWAIDMERQKLNITHSQLAVLSFIYYASGCGHQIIHSDSVYNSPVLPNNLKTSKEHILCELKLMGYVERFTRNPSAPYLSSSVNRHPVYLKLSDKAINMIQGVEGNIYKLIIHTSLDDLTGANKKPG